MKSKPLHVSLSPMNRPLRDLERPLQAEIDRTVNRKVGLYLTVLTVLSMLAMASVQWLLNVPASVVLVAGLLYVAGVFAFSLLKLRRVIQKVERFKQAVGGA